MSSLAFLVTELQVRAEELGSERELTVVEVPGKRNKAETPRDSRGVFLFCVAVKEGANYEIGSREVAGHTARVAGAGHRQLGVRCAAVLLACIQTNGRSRWTAIGRPAKAGVHGLRDEERESGGNLARVAAAAHLPESRAAVRGAAHHRNDERRHVAGCRHPAAHPADAGVAGAQFPRHPWRLTR